MNHKNIDNLIVKLFDNKLNQAERKILTAWLEKDENQTYFKEYIALNYAINSLEEHDYTDSLENLRKEIARGEKKTISKLPYQLAVAASVAALLFVAVLFKDKITSKDTEEHTPLIVNEQIKIGTDKAILTLEDGSNISLEKGETYKSENVESTGEKITYRKTEKSILPKIAYNTLTIPRGGQFFVELADNTKVWLNSESQLKYPVTFTEGATRKVELVYGEAYFEVSPSTAHRGAKFKVLTQEQEVEVLGTEFNIKAYRDESVIYTTLVEGKVALHINDNINLLQPEEQAIFNRDKISLMVKTVDVFDVISWKNGVFSFKDLSLKQIMKVLSRWYDVKVIFENKMVENIHFNGVLRKDQHIEDILNIINNTNDINYTIQDETILIK